MAKRYTGGRAQSVLTAMVLAEYGTTCHLCLQPGATTKDHLIPVSYGGTDSLANLRPAHHRCNSHRRNRLLTPALLSEFRDTPTDTDGSHYFSELT